MTAPRVLILDGNQRSALAATRSLGRRGIPVVAADETDGSLAGASRFREASFRYPSPYLHPDDFIETIIRESQARGVGVIFPMTEVTVGLLLRNREKFGAISVPFPDWETFEALTDKGNLFRLAGDLGVTMPETRRVDPGEDPRSIAPGLRYPVVLKPCRSRVWQGGRWMAASVVCARSEEEFLRAAAEHEYFRAGPFLIQEYIQGVGQGIFTLYDRGRPLAFFAHRRLRERPPSGGVSVLSESIEVDPAMREMSGRILDRVRWHGVAMVEFRVADSGIPYLMEVNARFWGSLQLSVDAGIDFPHLLYRLAIGEPPGEVEEYRVGVRSRWLLGDLDHLYLTFKERNGEPGKPRSRWRALARFVGPSGSNTRFEVNRWEDPRPFLFEIKNYLRRSG